MKSQCLSVLSLFRHGGMLAECGGSEILKCGCQARELVRQRVDAEVEAARRDIDAREIAQIPRAKLEPLYVNFGFVAKDAQQHITLTNCGQVGSVCEGAVCCDQWTHVTYSMLLLSIILPDTGSALAEMCLMDHAQRDAETYTAPCKTSRPA